jgi:hypothetical protein
VSQDWPSAHPHGPQPLPRTEDLPVVWEGYDRARVDAAFDAFYRHIAQLDSTMRALESVEVFRQQAGELRADLRSIRAAGWAPYPRGYALAPERSLFGSVPSAVPRIALEVIFLIGVAAVVAAAEFSTGEIVAVMGGAVLITFLVEVLAARDRREKPPGPLAEPAAVAEPAPAAVRPVPKPVTAAAPSPQPTEDGAGWAAFAEQPGQDARTLMGALSVEDAREEVEADAAPEALAEPVAAAPEPPIDESTEETPADEQPEALDEPEPLPVAAVEPEPEPVPIVAVEPEPLTLDEAEPLPVAVEPEPLTLDEAEPLPVAAVEPEPLTVDEAEPSPVAAAAPDSEPTDDQPGTLPVAPAEREVAAPPKRRRFRRRGPDARHEEPAPPPVVEPKHVRVLPPTDTAVEDTPHWERGFDDTEERRA